MAHEGLTTELWEHVVGALPDAHKLARSVARRCTSMDEDELARLAEDSLMRRARHFDPGQGTKLIGFARRGIRLDLFRAAYARASDPCVAAGLSAFDRHEEAMGAPDVAARFAETLEDKHARALAMGGDLMSAAHYAYAGARAAKTPEEDLAEHEEWRELKRAAAGAGEGAGDLLDLLYVEDKSWEDAAAALGIDVRQAQRIEAKAIARLRAIILARRRNGS